MAIFRKIHVQFWGDTYIQSLSPEKKFFYLYLLTNEKTRQCGIYEITPRQMSFDTGYTVETILTLIDYFVNERKIMFSRETNEIAVKNWNRYNGSKSVDVQTLVNKELKLVKNKKLIEWVQSVDRVLPQSKSFPIQEPEEEPEQEREVEEEVGSEKISLIANEVWKDQKWKEGMCIGLTINMEELKKWLALFNTSIATTRQKNFDKSSYMRMSRGWIVIQKEKGTKVETGLQKKSDAPPLTTLNGI